jgi:hypothetical protein
MGGKDIRIRRDQVEAFAAECESIVEDLNAGRYPLLGAYAGSHDGYRPSKWRDGVKVTLGTVDYPHSGRRAGELLADKVGAVGYALVSVEEGFRALAVIARRALDDFAGHDDIAADELRALVTSYDAAARPETMEHTA